MKSITTLFKCESVKDLGDSKEIVLRITDDVDENSDACKSTTEGYVDFFADLGTPAFGFFIPGEIYKLTFKRL